jgi:hypothetical protein
MTKKRLLVAAAIGLVPVLLFAVAWNAGIFQSAEQQLAAIEATRMVPDSENAGVLYTRLANSPFAKNFGPPYLEDTDAQGPRNRAWKSEDHPQLDRWIEENNDFFTVLRQSLKFDRCYLPRHFQGKSRGRRHIDWTGRMLPWAYLLIWAANNDMAEQRTDGAIEKYASAMRMSTHLYQQPIRSHYSAGLYLETAWANDALKELILDGHLGKEQLNQIETALPPAGVICEKEYRKMCHVESLVRESQRPKTSLTLRIKMLWNRIKRGRIFVGGANPRQPIDSSLYLRVLAQRRAFYILVALRRYMDRTGRWPNSLKEMNISKRILTEPQSGDAFVYRLTDDGFALYSKGPNGVDDGGSLTSDDQRAWPVRLDRPNANEENVDDEQ